MKTCFITKMENAIVRKASYWGMYEICNKYPGF